MNDNTPKTDVKKCCGCLNCPQCHFFTPQNFSKEVIQETAIRFVELAWLENANVLQDCGLWLTFGVLVVVMHLNDFYYSSVQPAPPPAPWGTTY